MIKPQIIQRHYFWSNIKFPIKKVKCDFIYNGNVKQWEKIHGFDLSNYGKEIDKRAVLRNCVNSELGLHIFNFMTKGGQLQLPIETL